MTGTPILLSIVVFSMAQILDIIEKNIIKIVTVTINFISVDRIGLIISPSNNV